MKKLFSAFALLLVSASLLSGCGPSREPLSQRVKEVIDMGATPLPNSTDKLHGYRVVNPGMEQDHFVYIVERDGQPFAGTAANRMYSSGKSSHLSSVTSVVKDAAPAEAVPVRLTFTEGAPTLQVQCANEAQCARITAAIETAR